MKSAKIPIIILIVLLFVAIFLWGSVLDSFTGEGIYLAQIDNRGGTQHLETVIRFDPNNGTRQMFSMFNFIYNTGDGSDVPESVTKTLLEYTGNYYKEVTRGIYLRPTGLHFPVITFEPGTRLVMNWSVLDLVSLDVEGNPLELEWANISHSSQVVLNGDEFVFDDVTYTRLDTVPENYQQWMDMLDSAMDAKNEK